MPTITIENTSSKNKTLPMLFLFFLLFMEMNAQQLSANSNDAPFILSGVHFENNGNYPKLYTCDSTGISPALEWKNAPKNTKSFAITMHHYPRTGDKHVYWVVYNIPPTTTSITENQSGVYAYGKNTVNGRNTYTPPCSKGPGAKTYTITLYALSETPSINTPASQVTMDLLLKSIENIKLDSAVMNVHYSRPSNLLAPKE